MPVSTPDRRYGWPFGMAAAQTIRCGGPAISAAAIDTRGPKQPYGFCLMTEAAEAGSAAVVAADPASADLVVAEAYPTAVSACWA